MINNNIFQKTGNTQASCFISCYQSWPKLYCAIKSFLVYEIWVSHYSVDEDSSLLGRCAIPTGKYSQLLRRIEHTY